MVEEAGRGRKREGERGEERRRTEEIGVRRSEVLPWAGAAQDCAQPRETVLLLDDLLYIVYPIRRKLVYPRMKSITVTAHS